MRRIRNFDDQAVGGLGDAADSDPVQRAAQAFAQHVQEKAAIASLEPQLMVVNDNVRRSHHSHWPTWADARSIQPPASRFAGKLVVQGGNSQAGKHFALIFRDKTGESKAATGSAKQLTP